MSPEQVGRRRLTLERTLIAAHAASSKTLEETVVLSVGDLISITDYFVIASGRTDRQVRAIVDAVTEAVRAAGGSAPRNTEGISDCKWVLLDYGDFIVHVFDGESREFYNLERLWSDAERVGFEAAPAGVSGSAASDLPAAE